MDLKITLLLCSLFTVYSQELTLKQVVILSRHNVRTPLSRELQQITPNSWPQWKEKRGFLTAKGAVLEGFMGSYFVNWLRKEGLLLEKCPSEESFYVYANLLQRTMASAQAFVSRAFPECNITIHHSTGQSDPVFNPIIHNTSSTFKHDALEQMRELLKSFNFNSSYEAIGSILDYKQSEHCIKEKQCDLKTDKNQIAIMTYLKPGLEGPLKISKSAIDSFIMENYEGFPLKSVAWGKLVDIEQWQRILDLSVGYHSVLFNTTLIAKDIAEPLIKYMTTFFIQEKQPKVTLLMGHDANMYTVIKSMGFKAYKLKNQHELIPAGGKIVFQKWYDEKNKVNLLKIDYVYQSTDQMRNGVPLSMENPPEFTSLTLEGCNVNEKGFCSWDDFIKLLRTL